MYRHFWIKVSEFLLLVILVCSCTGTGKKIKYSYKTYYNFYYEYAVDYPAELLNSQGESLSGDGQVFFSKDKQIQLIVFGFRNLSHDSVKNISLKYLKNESKGISKILHATYGKNEGLIVALIDNNYFYQKVLMGNDTVKILQIRSKKASKQKLKFIIDRMIASFRHMKVVWKDRGG